MGWSRKAKNVFIQEYPDYELITDIGSGINWKRKGLKKLLGNVEQVVVAHRDRIFKKMISVLNLNLI